MLRCGFIPSQRYYIYDEWNDHKMDKGRAHYFTSAGGKMGRTGFTPSLKRPKWTVRAGTWNASGETLNEISRANNRWITTPSTFAVGTWEYSVKFDVIAGEADSYTFFMTDTILNPQLNGNGYLVNQVDEGSYLLRKVVAGVLATIIAGVWATNTAWHSTKITRDSNGDFEYFFDGVSKGTVNDIATTTSVYFAPTFNTSAGDAHMDDLKVY